MCEGETQELPLPSPPHDSIHLVRLYRHFILHMYTTVNASVVTKLQGTLVSESKHSLLDKYKVRTMNSIDEVVSHVPFSILFSHFYAQERDLPNNDVVELVLRPPIEMVNIYGSGAQ